MLSTDTRLFAVESGTDYFFTFISPAIFMAHLVVIHKVLSLNHNDAGKRCIRLAVSAPTFRAHVLRAVDCRTCDVRVICQQHK